MKMSWLQDLQHGWAMTCKHAVLVGSKGIGPHYTYWWDGNHHEQPGWHCHPWLHESTNESKRSLCNQSPSISYAEMGGIWFFRMLLGREWHGSTTSLCNVATPRKTKHRVRACQWGSGMVFFFFAMARYDFIFLFFPWHHLCRKTAWVDGSSLLLLLVRELETSKRAT